MDYRPYVRERAQAYGIDPNLAEALLGQESGGNPNAESPKKAFGLMQLIPGTAAELGVDPKIPEQNIDGGLRYLKQQIDKFGVAGGLAAYNAGPGRMARTNSFEELPAETRAYVPAIMNQAALLAERGAVGKQAPQPSPQPGQRPVAMDINTLIGGYQKATQANDAEASAEIGGLIQQQYQGALAKAKAAGDQEAVTEITQSMSSFGAPKAQAAPASVAPTPVAQARPAAPAPAASSEASALRGLSLGTRGVLQGVEKAFTFPVKAVGEAVSSVLGMAGQAKAADYVSRTFGMKNQGAGALLSDAAGLATPSTKTEKAMNSGIEAASGLVTGTGIAKVAEKAPQAIKSALSVLMPGTAGSATSVAKDVAINGGLGASIEAAPAETAAGLALLVGGKMAAGKYVTSRGADKIISKAGTQEGARIDSEIIQDLRKAAGNGNLRDNDLMTNVINDLGNRYVNDVKNAVGRVDPEILKRLDIENILAGKKSVTPDELLSIQGTPAGDALVAAVTKFQRLGSITQQSHASTSLPALALRGAATATPALVGGLFGGIPGAILGAVLGPKAERFAQMATGKASRAEVTTNLIKRADSADEVLKRLGNSQASSDISAINELARGVEASQTAVGTAAKSTSKEKVTDIEKTVNKAREDTRSAIEDAMAAQMAPPTDLVSLATQVKAPKGLGENSPILKTIEDARRETGNAALDTLSTQQPSVKNMAENLATQRPQGTPQGILNTIEKARADTQAGILDTIVERQPDTSKLVKDGTTLKPQGTPEGILNMVFKAQGETNAGILDTAIARQPDVSNLPKNFTNPKSQDVPEGILNTIGKAQEDTAALFNRGMDGSTALKNEIKNVTVEGKAANGTAKSAAKAAKTEESTRLIEDFADGKLSETMGKKAPGFTTMLKFVDTDAPTLIKALQDYAKQNPARAQAAVDIMTLGGKANREHFYKIQEDLQKAFGSKVLPASEPGALSVATGAGSIRNPISYQEVVRTAGEAADIARKAAPSPELSQFATTVAGIKTPSEKAAAVADRLAKTTDQAETMFLVQFVEPLTKFGKKSK